MFTSGLGLGIGGLGDRVRTRVRVGARVRTASTFGAGSGGTKRRPEVPALVRPSQPAVASWSTWLARARARARVRARARARARVRVRVRVRDSPLEHPQRGGDHDVRRLVRVALE